MQTFKGKKIVVATHNRGKLREFDEPLGAVGVEAESARSQGLSEPGETGTTFEGNAKLKAVCGGACDGLAGAIRRFRAVVDALWRARG